MYLFFEILPIFFNGAFLPLSLPPCVAFFAYRTRSAAVHVDIDAVGGL